MDQAPRPVADASVTVFPVLLADRASSDVANVIGILLERGGLQRVEPAQAAFAPDRTLDVGEQGKAFGAFVGKSGLQTDYALFTDILGTPQAGITELRGVLVDRTGNVVWSDRQKAGEAAWERSKPREPMDCCVLLVQQLRAPLHLDDPMRANAPQGRLEARMQQKAGVPSPAEFAAMEQRLADLKKLGPNARFKVCPPRLGGEWSVACATQLAAGLEKAGLGRATAIAQPMQFAVEASSNEQQVLWSAARSLQKTVRAAGPQDAYTVCGDFLMQKEGVVGAVHTFVLSPTGEFVIVDFQNSHHADFQRRKMDSADACVDLALARLVGRLR